MMDHTISRSRLSSRSYSKPLPFLTASNSRNVPKPPSHPPSLLGSLCVLIHFSCDPLSLLFRSVPHPEQTGQTDILVLSHCCQCPFSLSIRQNILLSDPDGYSRDRSFCLVPWRDLTKVTYLGGGGYISDNQGRVSYSRL